MLCRLHRRACHIPYASLRVPPVHRSTGELKLVHVRLSLLAIPPLPRRRGPVPAPGSLTGYALLEVREHRGAHDEQNGSVRRHLCESGEDDKHSKQGHAPRLKGTNERVLDVPLPNLRTPHFNSYRFLAHVRAASAREVAVPVYSSLAHGCSAHCQPCEGSNERASVHERKRLGKLAISGTEMCFASPDAQCRAAAALQLNQK